MYGSVPRNLAFLLNAIAFTQGCAGDQCYEDDECLSGACTWGTCDSAIVNAILEPKSEEPPHVTEPAPEWKCTQTLCPAWPPEDCEKSPGCELQLDVCFSRSLETCSLDDRIRNACPKECWMRSEAECTGDCYGIYSCQPVNLGCGDLPVDQCESRPGCTLTSS